MQTQIPSIHSKFQQFLTLQSSKPQLKQNHILDPTSLKQHLIDELNYKIHQKKLNNQTKYPPQVIILLQSKIRGNLVRKSIAKQVKNYKHCKNVIKELVTTEEGYLQDLHLIQLYIIQPLKSLDILPQTYYDIFFSNINQIYEIHLQLNNQFQTKIHDQFDYLNHIGKSLQQIVFQFKNYFQYYRTFSTSQELIKDLKKSDPQFAQFLLSLKQNKNLRYLGWEGFLVKPVQRLPKYTLLLQDFLKHCQHDHLLKIYQDAFDNIKKVIEDNNAQLTPVVDLPILDLSKRLFLYQERMSLLIENQEKEVLLYVFNDLLLVYDQEDHYIKHCLLNERSKNLSLTFVGASKQNQEQMLKQIQSIIKKLKRYSVQEIEVQVIGTEERDGLQSYTIYVVQITIGDVVSKCYLRFSDLTRLREQLRKDFSKEFLQDFPIFQNLTFLKKQKVIEIRIQEMEDFILHLLVNEDFQKANNQRYLEMLGLDPNFYKLPSQLTKLKQNRKIKHDRTSSLLVVRETQEEENQQLQKQESLQVQVNFHTGSRVDLEIPLWFRGIDLIQLVSDKVELKDHCDFRLFECDEQMDKMRPLGEEEFIKDIISIEQNSSINKIISYFKKKVIVLRKYLYFPDQIQDDEVRTTLICHQIFFDMRKQRYTFGFDDYCLFVSMYMLLGNRQDIQDILQNLIPKQTIKQYSKQQWNDMIINKLSITQEIMGNQNQLIGQLFIKLVSKSPFYGMEILTLSISEKDMEEIKNYVKMRINRDVNTPGFSLGVQFGKLSFVDSINQTIYMQFQYSDFDQILAYSDMIKLFLDDRKIEWTFLTQQGFQIMNLIQEYEYLEIELQKRKRKNNINK